MGSAAWAVAPTKIANAKPSDFNQRVICDS
jgi:hypothetical protein